VTVIETDRLLLEPLSESRLEEFVVLTANPETMRYWGPNGPFSRTVAEQNFAAALTRLREHGFGRRWIVDRATGSGLGFAETKYFGSSCAEVSPDEVEIGWMLAPSVWRRGYGTEAGLAVRDEAFQELGFDTVVAVHHPENPASGRIMEKLGMSYERDLVDLRGWPYRFYRITREDWTALR
jgi:RimJ/RimL family protein N-acetyltransferase